MTTPTLLPFATHELIPPGSNDPTIVPVGNVFHIAVSESSDLHDFFATRSGGIESHGYILRDGTVKQYRALNREADAQADGNSFTFDGKLCGFLSWETQGGEFGEWTTAQVATIKRIILWTHANLGTPLTQTPAWNRPGNGYHSLFSQWNPNGHTCPGRDRIQQWPSILKEIAVTVQPAVANTRWHRTRARLLAALNHEDALKISPRRVHVRAFLAATRAGIKLLPKG